MKLIYVLVAHVEDRVGTNMHCHTIALACVPGDETREVIRTVSTSLCTVN